jgi:hypothetical protein
VLPVILGVAVISGACGTSATGTTAPGATTAPVAPPATTGISPETTAAHEGGACAHVVGVDVEAGPSGYTFSVTVSSTETGWDKYADLWVVRAPEGSVLGERVLAHPHVEEQPFTRSQSGIQIPDDIAEVTVAARDSVLGFCGDEFTVLVPAGDG